MSLPLPYPGYLAAIAKRSLLLWILVRLVFAVFLLLLVGAEAALHQPTLGIPAILVLLDRRFFHEHLLPANLGESEVWFWATSLGVVLGLDVMAALLVVTL